MKQILLKYIYIYITLYIIKSENRNFRHNFYSNNMYVCVYSCIGIDRYINVKDTNIDNELDNPLLILSK